MKKLLALLLILTLGACSSGDHEYETELTNAYGVPLITVEKDTLYYGERRVEITNNSSVPISYVTKEIDFDVDYTEQDIDVWADENLAPATSAIFDHIMDNEEVILQPNESMILIIDMASHPFDVTFSLNFDIDGEEVVKEITLLQNEQ